MMMMMMMMIALFKAFVTGVSEAKKTLRWRPQRTKLGDQV